MEKKSPFEDRSGLEIIIFPFEVRSGVKTHHGPSQGQGVQTAGEGGAGGEAGIKKRKKVFGKYKGFFKFH